MDEDYMSYCYDSYYARSKCTAEYYDAIAEREDKDYEDRVFEELNEEEF